MLLCSGLHIWREHSPVGHTDPQELDEAEEGERKGYGEIYRAESHGVLGFGGVCVALSSGKGRKSCGAPCSRVRYTYRGGRRRRAEGIYLFVSFSFPFLPAVFPNGSQDKAQKGVPVPSQLGRGDI